MNPDVKAQWVEALRSGEYEQGRSKLRDHENKFCCLGVLCDLHSKAKGIPWVGERYIGSSAMPPVQVWSWAGFSPPPQLQDPLTCQSLTSANDSGTSFSVIADMIEAQL